MQSESYIATELRFDKGNFFIKQYFEPTGNGNQVKVAFDYKLADKKLYLNTRDKSCKRLLFTFCGMLFRALRA